MGRNVEDRRIEIKIRGARRSGKTLALEAVINALRLSGFTVVVKDDNRLQKLKSSPTGERAKDKLDSYTAFLFTEDSDEPIDVPHVPITTLERQRKRKAEGK